MKLNGAIVCSNCEEIYSSQYEECPSCLGRHYWHLRDYVEPLFKFGGPHETVINKVQKEPQGISDSLTYHHNDAYLRSLDNTYGEHNPPAAHPVSISDCGRNPAGLEPAVTSLLGVGRILGEAISDLKKGRDRFKSSTLADLEAQVEQEGSAGSGKEPDRRGDNIEAVHA